MSIYIPAAFLDFPRYPIAALALPLALGVFSGSGVTKVVDSPWYQTLRAPPGRPPRQVFPVVWPVLYLSMGYASYIAAKTLAVTVNPQARDALKLGLGLYYAQLAFNCAWCPLFFSLKDIGVALVDSVILTATSYVMTATLHEPTGGQTTYFLLPYCAWLTFATYLNGGIWYFNRTKSGIRKD